MVRDALGTMAVVLVTLEEIVGVLTGGRHCQPVRFVVGDRHVELSRLGFAEHRRVEQRAEPVCVAPEAQAVGVISDCENEAEGSLDGGVARVWRVDHDLARAGVTVGLMRR